MGRGTKGRLISRRRFLASTVKGKGEVPLKSTKTINTAEQVDSTPRPSPGQASGRFLKPAVKLSNADALIVRKPRLTKHAKERMVERNISSDSIRIVLAAGT